MSTNSWKRETAWKALKVLEIDRKGFHLLLTDIVMPSMSGVALARMAALKNHRLKVLYMTGFSEVALDNVGRLLGGVLNKPFKIDELLKAVWQALNPSELDLQTNV
jgi:DNA-binding NtrC family response regulator